LAQEVGRNSFFVTKHCLVLHLLTLRQRYAAGVVQHTGMAWDHTGCTHV